MASNHGPSAGVITDNVGAYIIRRRLNVILGIIALSHEQEHDWYSAPAITLARNYVTSCRTSMPIDA
jgi:hypothetical protein